MPNYVNSSCSLLSETNPLKLIERCGRVCYKSEDKITPDSYKTFCKRLFDMGHLAVFEHANFTFRHTGDPESFDPTFGGLLYGVETFTHECQRHIVLNLRHVLELRQHLTSSFLQELPAEVRDVFWDPDTDPQHLWQGTPFPYVLAPNNLCSKNTYYTFYMTIQRSVWDELARHRRNALNCESTRYCNYSSGKFKALTFVEPYWWNTEGNPHLESARMEIVKHLRECENLYTNLINLGLKPQDARYVLPLGIKSECCITFSLYQFEHIYSLRSSPSAHPDIRLLVNSMQQCISDVCSGNTV